MGIKHGAWALVKFTSSQDLPTKGGTGELERATSKVRGKELRQKQVPWTEAEALAVCKLGSMNLLPTKCLCTIAPSVLSVQPLTGLRISSSQHSGFPSNLAFILLWCNCPLAFLSPSQGLGESLFESGDPTNLS